jgi:phosphohistidine phosphatase
MRRLILMRHAKSSRSDPTERDLDRPLTKRGRRASAQIGRWLAENGYAPDRALVSNARRAQETWNGVVETAGAAATRYLPDLYNATPDTLLAVLRAVPGAPALLMLGHQPGIGEFARRLLAEPPATAEFEKFPTAATAIIDFEIDDWAATEWGTGRLVDFAVPRALADRTPIR